MFEREYLSERERGRLLFGRIRPKVGRPLPQSEQLAIDDLGRRIAKTNLRQRGAQPGCRRNHPDRSQGEHAEEHQARLQILTAREEIMAIATSAVTESVSMMKRGNVTRKDNNRAELLKR
jgi:hypothetical protein